MASVIKREGYGFEVRYVDPATGKRRSKTCKLKKQADAFLRKVEREIEDGVHVADKETRTIAEVADEYIRNIEARVRDGRIGRAYSIRQIRIVEQKIIPELGRKPIRDLTAPDVDAFYNTMIAKYRLSPSTAKWQVYGLRYLERFALKRKYTKREAVSEALQDLRGITVPPIRTFTAEQVTALFTAAASHRKGLWKRPQALTNVMVHLAALCGLRMGEILGLTLPCIDLERGLLRIRHSMTEFDVLKGPKTAAGVRDVPMPRQVATVLSDWLAQHYEANERQLAFRTVGGGFLSTANLNKPWRRLLTDAGLRNPGDEFHFHALRHFCASYMIEKGIPVTDVAALLGHSKFDVTLQVYAHPLLKPHLRHEAMQRLDTVLPAVISPSLTHQ